MKLKEEEKHYINSIFYEIEQTAKYCKSLGTQVFQKLNLPITLDEFAALDTIFLYGEICQRDLARLILKDRPSTGRILSSLEKRNYIKRFIDTKNNRLVRKMSLTSEGEIILDRATKTLRDYTAHLPEIFPDEDVKKLKESIQKFKKCLEKEVELNI